jgi:hypothetical protein
MKAKDKARDLAEKYRELIPFNDNEFSEKEMYQAQLSIIKQCVLITVYEMLDCNSTSVYFEEDFEFWKEVKYEIVKIDK